MKTISHFRVRLSGASWAPDDFSVILDFALRGPFIDNFFQLQMGTHHVSGEPLVFSSFWFRNVAGGVDRPAPFEVEYTFELADYGDIDESLITGFKFDMFGMSPPLSATVLNSADGISFKQVAAGPVGTGLPDELPVTNWGGGAVVPTFWRSFVRTHETP